MGMNQLSLAHILQVPYLLLCSSVLEVGIDSSKSNGLAEGCCVIDPCILHKVAIVCMVGLYLNTMPLCISLESMLSLESF